MPNESGGAALVAQEQANKVEAQARKYRQSIPFIGVLTASGTPGAQILSKIRMSSEGDFLVTHVTCKIVAFDPTSGTVVDPATFGGTGLSLKISESGWGRELLRDYTALETLATPGYGEIIYQPFPFEQVLLSESDVTFDVRNAITTVNQTFKWSFHGWQYRGSFKVKGR